MFQESKAIKTLPIFADYADLPPMNEMILYTILTQDDGSKSGDGVGYAFYISALEFVAAVLFSKDQELFTFST